MKFSRGVEQFIASNKWDAAPPHASDFSNFLDEVLGREDRMIRSEDVRLRVSEVVKRVRKGRAALVVLDSLHRAIDQLLSEREQQNQTIEILRDRSFHLERELSTEKLINRRIGRKADGFAWALALAAELDQAREGASWNRPQTMTPMEAGIGPETAGEEEERR